MTDAEVVVVGAGLAGLQVARRLLAQRVEVLVLEARDRVGGRLENAQVPGYAGTVVELGGQWIGPSQGRMTALVAELGLETFPSHNDGEILLLLDGKRARMASHRGAVPKLNPLVVADLAQAQLRLGRLSRTIPLEAPWTAPRARTLDARTFAGWVSANLCTRTGRAFLSAAIETIFAADPADLSLLHVLFYLHSGGDLDTLINFDQGAQQDRIVGGSARIAEAMAAALGDRVRLGRPVRRIDHGEQGVEVHADGGGSVSAARVVVTLPPTLAGRLVYSPALPSWRDQLTQRLPAGSVIKTYAVYPTPFWREEGFTGSVVNDRSPVGFLVDNSPPTGTPGVLLGFIEGRAARQLSRGTEQDRRQALVDAAVAAFGPRAASPELYLERDWSAEEYTRGCYGAHFPTGVWTSYGPALREPVGPIHWAGAETAAVWNGYLEGAVRSGDAAAEQVLAALA
jgi:monoamine oxidase